MILYHGSDHSIKLGDSLRTPTGISSMDVLAGGVVYMTDDPELCKRYGTVYVVEVSDAVSYKVQREKQGLPSKKSRYTKGVWVALPENTSIVGTL